MIKLISSCDINLLYSMPCKIHLKRSALDKIKNDKIGKNCTKIPCVQYMIISIRPNLIVSAICVFLITSIMNNDEQNSSYFCNRKSESPKPCTNKC